MGSGDGLMRGAGLLRAAATVGAVVIAASCGSDGADDGDASTGSRSVSGGVITAGLTGFVVAGDEAGWVVDQNDIVWRIDLDGDATQTELEIPVYNRGFSGFVDGVVVFGGTRCDGRVVGEGCDGEAVVEMRLLRESDETLETVELFRKDGGRYRSIGAGVLGVANDTVWVSRDTGELATVDAEGTVTEQTIPTGAGTGRSECMVDGEIYGIRDAAAPTTSSESDGGPAPTSYDPGTQATHTWVVDHWDGAEWVPLANGAHTIEGPDTSLTCTAQGFVSHPYGDHTPLADWTPEFGWQPAPPSTSGLSLGSLLTSTTETYYTVSEGTLQRVDFASDQLAATPITEASLDAPTGGAQPTPAEIDIVDDAGTLLIACTTSQGTADCVVTPDN